MFDLLWEKGVYLVLYRWVGKGGIQFWGSEGGYVGQTVG